MTTPVSLTVNRSMVGVRPGTLSHADRPIARQKSIRYPTVKTSTARTHFSKICDPISELVRDNWRKVNFQWRKEGR